MTKFRKALCTILFFSLIVPCWVHALEIQSKNAILYNVNEDTVLFSKEPDEKVPIASLTKIMTAIMAIENISNMDEVVSIPSVALEGLAEKNAMVVGFKANERVTYLDLLYGILLPSGADATNVVAYYLAGSEENYVNLMNEKAKELGLVNTHFSDTSGLDDVHNYSTVSDIAKLLQYALHNETFKKIFTSQEYTTSNGLKLKSTLTYYTEQYHLQNEYIYGSKTGFTTIAGFCLASIAHHDGVEYLLVTTGAPTTNRYPYHFVDAFAIYEYFMENYNIDTSRVFAEGYSGGGETMSQVMGKRPDLFTAYLQCSSQWDGDYEPVVKSRTPIYFVIGEDDEYYGSQPTREAYETLYNMYRDQGLTDQEIDELLVLDIKDADYFESWGVTVQHGGGGLFAQDSEIMGWLFNKR